jgi:hypothetical protein
MYFEKKGYHNMSPIVVVKVHCDIYKRSYSIS